MSSYFVVVYKPTFFTKKTKIIIKQNKVNKTEMHKRYEIIIKHKQKNKQKTHKTIQLKKKKKKIDILQI